MSAVEESKQLTVVPEDRERLSIEYWAPLVLAAIQRCRDADTEKVEAFAALGDVLNAAVKCLGYGKRSTFAAMIKRSDLNIGRRTADKYRKFAKDEEMRRLADVLPPSIETIDKLAALPREQFHELRAGGVVTPKMQRKDVPRSRELPPLEPRPRAKTAKELEIELDSAQAEIRQLRRQCLHSGDKVLAARDKIIAAYGIGKAQRIAKTVLAGGADDDDEEDEGAPSDG
jgi:hypothetical protein